MRNFISLFATVLLLASASAAPAQPTQENAQTAVAAPTAYQYLFFFKERDPNTENLWNLVQTTLAPLGPQRAQFRAVDVTNPAEANIVAAYGLERAPMPMALAIAPNGAIMGAYPNKFDGNQLLSAIGTPLQEVMVRAFQDNKMVLLAVQNQNTRMNVEAMQGIQAFQSDPMLAPYTQVFSLDPADPQEARVVQQLQLSPALDTATTLLMTPPGVTVGMWNGPTTKEAILSSLTTKGCGPDCKCLQDQQANAGSGGTLKKFFKKIAGN